MDRYLLGVCGGVVPIISSSSSSSPALSKNTQKWASLNIVKLITVKLNMIYPICFRI